MDLGNDAMTSSAFLRPVAPEPAWESLRFPGELELRREVERRETLAPVVGLWSDPRTAPRGVPASFLEGGMKVGPGNCPSLYCVAGMLRDVLRLPQEPVVHLYAGNDFFVDVLRDAVNGAIQIATTSAAVNEHSTGETMFHLGRRIARRLFDQVPLAADPTAGVADPNRETLLLRGLWRFQELTCDRIGLVCCQDEVIAARAILRRLSGLPQGLLEVDLDQLLADRLPEEEAMIRDGAYEFALLRIAALRQFIVGDKYASIFTSKAFPAPAPEPAAALLRYPDVTEVREEIGEFEPIGEEPELGNASTPVAPEETPRAGDPFAEARRRFTLWGSMWVLGGRPSLAERTRAELWEYFGSEANAAEELAAGPDGEERCARRCVVNAPVLSDAPMELRMETLEDVLHLLLLDGELGARDHERVLELADLLQLTRDQVATLESEYVDPEYARYRFQVGQDVEVRLDDEWLTGAVRRIEPNGDLRVHFPSTNETLWLSPTADLIRPAFAKSA